jgi:hypothetical protein
MNANFGCQENEIIFHDRSNSCVVMDVHQKILIDLRCQYNKLINEKINGEKKHAAKRR